MRTLSLPISSWRVGSVHASVPDAHAQYTLQFLTRMLSMLWRDLFKFGICMLMLSIRVRNWCVCSGYASVPDSYAQLFLKGMRSLHAFVPDAYAQCMHQFLTRMLSVRITSWRACSVHASLPDVHADGIQNKHLINRKTDVHAKHARKELMRMLRVASAPDAQLHQLLTCMLSVHIKVGACTLGIQYFWSFLNYLKKRKNFKIAIDTNKWSQKLHEKTIFWPNLKKILKIRLSIRVRNFAAPNEPLNILKTNFYFNPKVPPPPPKRHLWQVFCVKIIKNLAIEKKTNGQH